VVIAPPDQVVAERHAVDLAIVASDDDLPVQPLAFSLVGTVPRGASIGATTGRFTWTPDPTQGPSSNRFVVRVSDGVAATETAFLVVVRDTEADFSMDLGEAIVAAGSGGSVPLGLHSTLDLSAIRVRLLLDKDAARDLAFTGGTGIGSSSLVPTGELEYELELLPSAGQTLRLDANVGSIGFATRADQTSAFVRLVLHDAVGTLGSESLNRARLAPGRIVVVGERPLLDPVLDPDRNLRLHARPGLRYHVEQSLRFDGGAPWTAWRTIDPTGLSTRLPAPADGDVFLRAIRAP